ncbi:hypothetical protein J1770_gp39 [Gordonia phage EMoore]|uniref:Holin n=1 Tax=Gordonia phage EMoore TaxID=2656534 RepID=A0A649VV01_9CAUD|nr:hypothetical protein J1770_gp39 [Gordonia phage EMoore]QGJ95825.1 hypothetical protein SEA_EMOORE_39 [Gordonia phage EMoore]
MTDHYGSHAAPEQVLEGEVVPAGTPLTVGGVAADLVDKAIKTFAQTLLVYLGAGAAVSVLDVPWTVALQGALIATIGTVLLVLVQTSWTPANPYVDALARAARTFLASLAGAIPVVDPSHTVTLADVPWGQAAGIAGTLALVSLLTSLASMNLGVSKHTPSLTR